MTESTTTGKRRLQARDGVVGPDRVGYRSILCRSCARECSERIDGTWRHDHDGSILDGADGRCRNPVQVWADADAQPSTTAVGTSFAVADDRAEDEPCEVGTVGCCVAHSATGERCETW